MKKKIMSIALILALLVSCFTLLTACNDEVKTTDLLPNLTILYEQDSNLQNTYSVIAVNPDSTFVDINGTTVSGITLNTSGADAFINWLNLASTRELIAAYGVEDYGEQLFTLKEDATVVNVTIPTATEATKNIKLSTTTSVNDSGLLDYLLPTFKSTYGYDVGVVSAGTGAAINAAKYGNADVILVHSKSQEEAFVTAGFARVVSGFSAERITFMYNYFVLVGPTADPAGVKACADVKAAFAAIAVTQSKFISRGDASGTHTKEVSLWDTSLGITTTVANLPTSISGWYISGGSGMGACLTMANEQNAYILSDKATYLSYKKHIEEVVE